ncbi:MAG: hypothetical protein LLG08_11045 [Actinomycetia bacterium]|nr:hypothetical protein [Actinomycetes bacterium]
MPEERASYGTKPAQFRLPVWAHEFLSRESLQQNRTKTDILLSALEAYKRQRFEELLGQEYAETAAEDRVQVAAWDATVADGLETDEW